MKLIRLDIQQLPGIDRAFTLDNLAPGINLVTGPNAIGKSSLIRALRYLVAAPAGDDPAALSLSADFTNGGHWSVSRTGRGYSWHHDGQPAERPSLPDRESLHCYWLTMENLVQVGEDDRQLVDQLRQALAGGYDLPALRQGDFECKPRVGQNEGRQLQSAIRAQRDVESRYRALRQDEERLPQLDERIESARRARIRETHRNQALELLEVITERRGAQEALEQFPQNMEKLRGNERERLEQLEQTCESLRRHAQAAQRAHEDAETRLQRTGLKQSRPTQRELETARKHLENAQRLDDQLGERCEALDTARAEEMTTLKALGGNGQPPQLTPEQISRAERLATDLKSKDSEIREIEARLRNAEDTPDEQAIHRHVEGTQALIGWLAHAARGGKGQNWSAWLTVVGSVLVIVAALLVPAWYALAAGIIVLLGAIWTLRQPGRTDAEVNAEAQRDLEKQSLEVPSRWERDAVHQTLERLQTQLDTMRLARQQALSTASDRERLQTLKREQQELEEQKQQLAVEIGFNPSLTAVSVDYFVRQVQEYQRAAKRSAAIAATIERLEPEREQALKQVQEFLGRWRVDSGADPAELEPALSDLAGRAREAEAEEHKCESGKAELDRLKDDLTKREEEIAGLYGEAGLAPGDLRGLEKSCAQLETWKQQRQRLNEINVREHERRVALAEEQALVDAAENGDQEALQRERDAAHNEAERHDALLGERSDIKAQLDNAGSNRALESAMTAVDQARAALEDRMHEQLFAEAGQFLLDVVEREHRIEHEPDVLRDARERFRRFTHHAWDVELVGNALMARDLKQDMLRSLDALSSGTRMQLLLAVRLAWTRRLELDRESLPLFLDEALTTSDEKRFAAVAESLETLAREEGRQVFYLSARRQELGLWEKATGHRPHHIDLARIRSMEPATTAETYELPQERPLPVPDGRSPEAWAAEVGVPCPRPIEPATELHLFYLLRDDLALLHRLMRDWNISTLGPLQALLASPSAERAISDAAFRDKVLGRCRAAVAWMGAWRQGRGKPVDRIVLEQSGAVSDNYIEDVTRLAEEKNGIAEEIVAALENKAVSGFRTKRIEELRDYLHRSGYISTEDTLDEAGRERQVLLTVGRDTAPEEIRRVVLWLEAATR